MKIDYDSLEIAVVNGVKVRTMPLIVRGPDRRQAASESATHGERCKITLFATCDASGVYVIADPVPGGEDAITLSIGGRLAVVDNAKVKRVERRSGIERRVAP